MFVTSEVGCRVYRGVIAQARRYPQGYSQHSLRGDVSCPAFLDWHRLDIVSCSCRLVMILPIANNICEVRVGRQE